MSELPPIEYMKWRTGVPMPSFDDVVNMSLRVVGIDTENGRSVILHAKSCKYRVALQLALESCKHILGMSAVEFAHAVGYKGTSALRNRPGFDARYFSGTHASVAMVNEVTYCLIRERLKYVEVKRRECKPPPSEYSEAASRSLRNHAGGAV